MFAGIVLDVEVVVEEVDWVDNIEVTVEVRIDVTVDEIDEMVGTVDVLVVELVVELIVEVEDNVGMVMVIVVFKRVIEVDEVVVVFRDVEVDVELDVEDVVEEFVVELSIEIFGIFGIFIPKLTNAALALRLVATINNKIIKDNLYCNIIKSC